MKETREITLQNRVENVFESLKSLENVPITPKNVSIFDGVYDQLKIIYKELEGIKNGSKNGPAADPE